MKRGKKYPLKHNRQSVDVVLVAVVSGGISVFQLEETATKWK